MPVSTDKPISYFDISRLAEGQRPVDTFGYVNGPLIQTYAPGSSFYHTFQWLAARKERTYVLIEVQAFARPKDKQPIAYSRQWDLLCRGAYTPPRL